MRIVLYTAHLVLFCDLVNALLEMYSEQNIYEIFTIQSLEKLLLFCLVLTPNRKLTSQAILFLWLITEPDAEIRRLAAPTALDCYFLKYQYQ